MKNLFIKSFLLLSVLSLSFLFTGCNDLSDNSAALSTEMEEVVVDEATIEAIKGTIPGSCFDLIVPDAYPLLAGTGYKFEVANADCSRYRYSFNENRSDFVGHAGGCNWETLLARASGWQWVEVTLKNNIYGCSVTSQRYNYYVYNVKK